jgi:cytoskeleton protein RodZ
VRGRVVIESEWQWIDADTSAVDERPVIEDVDVVSAETARAPTLGEVLRAEREGQGVGLDQIEAATRIRAAQLRAIEEDRLDALPAEAYARGFVRAYADQLAIDADAMVRLFNDQWSRQFAADPEPPLPIRPPLVPAAARPLGVVTFVLALALLAVSATIFLTRGGDRSSPAAQPPPTSHAPSSTPTSSPPKTTVPPPPVPASLRLTVTATTGACWLEARRGSVAGPLLVERTLAPGDAVRLHGQRIWLRLGDPASVQLRLNGRPLRLAAAANPINLLVSRHGARAA